MTETRGGGAGADFKSSERVCRDELLKAVCSIPKHESSEFQHCRKLRLASAVCSSHSTGQTQDRKAKRRVKSCHHDGDKQKWRRVWGGGGGGGAEG